MRMGDFEEVEVAQGQYWRALQDIPERAITKGMVLLLQSIRDVDKTAHTIILRPHPSHIGHHAKFPNKEGGYTYRSISEHRFLVADFLSLFVLEPNHVAIRQREIGMIQKELGLLQ